MSVLSRSRARKTAPSAIPLLFGSRVDTFGAAVLAAAICFVAASSAFAHEFKAGALEIEHPWSRATPNGAKVAGGYFVVRNAGKTADRLLSATVEVAGRAEFHEMAVKDGVMTMRPIPDGLAVPAGGELAFTPGTFHLMLLDLKRPLKKGEKFDGTLTFEKAGTVKVEFAVEAIAATAAPHEGYGHTSAD